MYIYVYVCIYTHLYVCIDIYLYIYIEREIHIYIYIYIYIHIHTRLVGRENDPDILLSLSQITPSMLENVLFVCSHEESVFYSCYQNMKESSVGLE